MSGPFSLKKEMSGIILKKPNVKPKIRQKDMSKLLVMVNKLNLILFLIFLIIFKKKYVKKPSGPKLYVKIPSLKEQNSAKQTKFWQFSMPHRHVNRYGKFSNISIFAPCGLSKSGNQKVTKTDIFNFGRFH